MNYHKLIAAVILMPFAMAADLVLLCTIFGAIIVWIETEMPMTYHLINWVMVKE